MIADRGGRGLQSDRVDLPLSDPVAGDSVFRGQENDFTTSRQVGEVAPVHERLFQRADVRINRRL